MCIRPGSVLSTNCWHATGCIFDELMAELLAELYFKINLYPADFARGRDFTIAGGHLSEPHRQFQPIIVRNSVSGASRLELSQTPSLLSCARLQSGGMHARVPVSRVPKHLRFSSV